MGISERDSERCNPILSVVGLTKKFGGLIAVNNLTFDVESGELLGIIGPNGAGKTTLFNLISGLEKPTSGIIKFLGSVINGLPPPTINKMGIARTFQIPQPFTNMTVFQNLLVSAMYGAGLRRNRAKDEVEKVLDMMGLADKKHLLARDLTATDLRKLELARALCSKPKLLLIDEVAAGLALGDVPKLLDVLRDVQKEGVTIILIEHVMSVIMRIADRIIVLCEGKKLAEGKPYEITENKKVIEAYLGSYAPKNKGCA